MAEAISPDRCQHPPTPAHLGLPELVWGSGEPSQYSPREAWPSHPVSIYKAHEWFWLEGQLPQTPLYNSDSGGSQA